MADKISETGLWLDDKTGKLVKSQPRGGSTQIVREGGRITSAAQVRLDALNADPNASRLSAAAALGNPVDEQATALNVETATVKSVPGRATPPRK